MLKYIIIISLLLLSCAETTTLMVPERDKGEIPGIIRDWYRAGIRDMSIDTIKTDHGTEYILKYRN